MVHFNSAIFERPASHDNCRRMAEAWWKHLRKWFDFSNLHFIQISFSTARFTLHVHGVRNRNPGSLSQGARSMLAAWLAPPVGVRTSISPAFPHSIQKLITREQTKFHPCFLHGSIEICHAHPAIWSTSRYRLADWRKTPVCKIKLYLITHQLLMID